VRQLSRCPGGLHFTCSFASFRFAANFSLCSFPFLACFHGPCLPLPCKSFGTSVSREEQERPAHIGQRTSGADRTLATWLPLKPEALLLLTADVLRLRLRYGAAQTLVFGTPVSSATNPKKHQNGHLPGANSHLQPPTTHPRSSRSKSKGLDLNPRLPKYMLYAI
jgi:hypothetical protein